MTMETITQARAALDAIETRTNEELAKWAVTHGIPVLEEAEAQTEEPES